MSGKRSRNKGACGERELLKLLGDELGQSLNRNLTQTREGGGDCLEIRGWVIEVKRQERLSRPSWWAQACAQASGIGEPMLCYRRNREPWTCWIHTSEGKYREGSVQDAANAIREKWHRWP
jgi:hypothetical protein